MRNITSNKFRPSNGTKFSKVFKTINSKLYILSFTITSTLIFPKVSKVYPEINFIWRLYFIILQFSTFLSKILLLTTLSQALVLISNSISLPLFVVIFWAFDLLLLLQLLKNPTSHVSFFGVVAFDYADFCLCDVC